MAGLILKLRPTERLLINGAVIENGDRRCRLNILSPNVNVLRLRDAIHPEEAKTPVSRVCYIAQLLLAGETDALAGRDDLMRGIKQLQQALPDAPAFDILDRARHHLELDEIYHVLKELRSLLTVEARLMRS